MTLNEIISGGLQGKRAHLTEIESKELIGKEGIPVVQAKLARNKEEVVGISNELGYPVALKIISPDIIHKSDAGGVRLDLRDSAEVEEAFKEMIDSAKNQHPGADIQGISVQKMVSPGVEVIIGMTKDPQFGPVMMFGLGGVLVEILEDVSFRIIPLTKRDASEMIREIKGYPLLEGYRGQAPSDISCLEDLLVTVSKFIEKHPEVKELDLNPVFAYRNGAMVVDARIVLESTVGGL